MNRLLTGKMPLVAAKENTTAPRAAPVTAALLYERHLDAVFAYVSRRMASRAEAEDVTAEVFGAAFSGLAGFRGGSHLAWLLGIARRKIADHLRRRAKRRESLTSELGSDADAITTIIERASVGPSTPLQLVERHEAHRHVRALLDKLPADQREALLLQYVEELSIAEIGVVMGRSPHAVNSLLQRARANIFKTGSEYFLPEGGKQ